MPALHYTGLKYSQLNAYDADYCHVYSIYEVSHHLIVCMHSNCRLSPFVQYCSSINILVMYRKRSSEETDAGTSSTSEDFDKPPWKKQGLSVSTVENHILDNDKMLNTSTWLGYDKTGWNQVARLKCKVCQRFVDKIRGSRNFSAAFIDGSKNLQTTSFKDHACHCLIIYYGCQSIFDMERHCVLALSQIT